MAVLNSIMKTVSEGRTFHLFSSLPKELRLQIWEEAVPRERLIRVYLRVLEEMQDDPPPRYLEKNHLGKPISGPRYEAMAEGNQLNSKFLRVNKESRDVALAFYRVHIPFSLRMPRTGAAEKTTLYLNPENDVLHIDADAPVKETLIDFFWDMKAYDPKGVGLAKMAIDLEGFCAHDLQFLKRSDLLLIRQREALITALSQLKELWFVYVEPVRSRPPAMSDQVLRQLTGPGCCCNNVRVDGNNALTTGPDVVPITGSTSTFDRVEKDPRQATEAGLSRLYMGKTDPREIIWRWRRLLRTWGVRHQSDQVKYRLLVGQRPVSRYKAWRVGTVDQATEYMSVKKSELNDGSLLAAAEREHGEDACREITVAIGYWLFPVEAIGDVGESEKLSDMDFRPCRFLDVRDHQPELLLSSIN